MLADLDDDAISQIPRAQKIFNDLEDLPRPTVAAISNHALGVRLEVTPACDFHFMG